MLLPLLDGHWFKALLMYRRLKFPFIPYNIAHWALLSPCPWKAWTHLLCKRWLWCWWVADSQRCSKDALSKRHFVCTGYQPGKCSSTISISAWSCWNPTGTHHHNCLTLESQQQNWRIRKCFKFLTSGTMEYPWRIFKVRFPFHSFYITGAGFVTCLLSHLDWIIWSKREVRGYRAKISPKRRGKSGQRFSSTSRKAQTWENCVHIVQLRVGMTSFQSLSCCKLAKRWMHSGMSIRLIPWRPGDFQSRMQ